MPATAYRRQHVIREERRYRGDVRMTHESRRAAVNEEDVAVVLHCVVLRVAGVDIESVVRLPRRWRSSSAV